jgi:hypothetical protein
MRAGTQKLGTMQPAKLGTMQPAQQSRLPTMQPSQAKPPTMREFTPGTRPVQPMQSKPPTTPEFTPGTRPLQPMQSKPPTRPEFTPGNRPEGKLPTMQDSPFAKLPTMQPTAQKLSTMTPGSLRPTIPREDGPVPNPPAVIPGQKLGTLSPGSLRPTIPRDDDAPPPSHRAPTGMRPRAASFIFDEDLPPARRKQDSGVAIEEVAAESDRIADKRRE